MNYIIHIKKKTHIIKVKQSDNLLLMIFRVPVLGKK